MIAVGSGGALTALATSLRGWLTQPRRSDVRIRVTGEAGADGGDQRRPREQ